MSIKYKKSILIKYYREHGGVPKGNLEIDADTDSIGNVFLNDTYIGTFDFCKRKFINRE